MSMTTTALRIDAAEAKLRRDLAAAYRLVNLFGWDDLLATHISVRLPNEKGFLINPFGMLFDEIRPQDLIKVDMNGDLLEPSDYHVNKAGFVIHSAIHRARHDALCVMHLHTKDGIAVSTLKKGLLPLNQTAMLVYGDIAYHEFEGIAINMEERERLAADLGDKSILILRNHGTLTIGETVGDAFQSMYQLETACSIQVRAMGMNEPINPASEKSIEQVAKLRPAIRKGADLPWQALLRRLDRDAPHWDR